MRAFFRFHHLGGHDIDAYTDDGEAFHLVLGACEQLEAPQGWTVDLGACSSVTGSPREGAFVRVNLQQVVAVEWWAGQDE